LLEPAHPQSRIARQCDLVGWPRSTSYDKAQGESAEHLQVLRLLAQPSTDPPYDGVRRMPAWLRRQGEAVHHKRVARRRRPRGLETLDPTPRLSEPHPAHRVSPYWLRGVPITRVHQVWSTDITYMRLHGGFLSLVAVREWCRRSVRSWAVALTMDVGFCLAALDRAWEVARPALFTSAQGAQVTRLDLTGRLASAGLHMSMDGRGRALDNVCVERLWRTVQDAEV
jgi:putative transposase